MLDLVFGGGEFGDIFVVPFVKDVALDEFVGVRIARRRRVPVSSASSRSKVAPRVRRFAPSSSWSALVKVGSSVGSTSPALTCCPILTGSERTTDISTGWITISLSLVTILPLALTTISTFKIASAVATNTTRPT